MIFNSKSDFIAALEDCNTKADVLKIMDECNLSQEAKNILMTSANQISAKKSRQARSIKNFINNVKGNAAVKNESFIPEKSSTEQPAPKQEVKSPAKGKVGKQYTIPGEAALTYVVNVIETFREDSKLYYQPIADVVGDEVGNLLDILGGISAQLENKIEAAKEALTAKAAKPAKEATTASDADLDALLDEIANMSEKLATMNDGAAKTAYAKKIAAKEAEFERMSEGGEETTEEETSEEETSEEEILLVDVDSFTYGNILLCVAVDAAAEAMSKMEDKLEEKTEA